MYEKLLSISAVCYGSRVVVEGYPEPALQQKTEEEEEEEAMAGNFFSNLSYPPIEPSHQVCKPAYLVPVASGDKLGGLCKEGHPA